MGLDMYLKKHFYVKNWDHMSLQEKHEVIVKKNGIERTDINKEKISDIITDLMYWRKSNAIHNWFVKNVQNGQDDCREYYVDREKLEELLSLIKNVLADHSKAEELLQTQSGFFFGSTDYGEWYFKDLEKSAEVLEEELSKNNDCSYYYSSSLRLFIVVFIIF